MKRLDDSDNPMGARGWRAPVWYAGDRRLQPPGRPLVMGVINLTPDSFYPASRQDGARAAAAAARMAAAGAEVLDLGAESSRPGADAIDAAEEERRLLPALEAIRREVDLPLTVDTVRAETARLALDAGADAINDISASRVDPGMLELVADRGCGLILMHMLGTPRSMQDAPAYGDVVEEVREHLVSRLAAAEAAGINSERLCIDPGIGFGKLLEHNLALLAGLRRIAGGRPLLLGASRKSFISHLTGAPVDDRLGGSLAALAAAWTGGATMVRVHDVLASRQFLDTLAGIAAAGSRAAEAEVE